MLATPCRLCRQAVATLGIAAGLIVLPGATLGGDPLPGGTRYAIHIDHEATAGTLRRVLDGARLALDETRCQAVLDEFSDLTGTPLRARLQQVGQAPGDYLGLIIFYDGRTHPRCTQDNVLAVTQVGSRVVFVCPQQLAARARRNPRWTEATIIHEALHTLGLGENPPSSQEITRAVMRRCE